MLVGAVENPPNDSIDVPVDRLFTFCKVDVGETRPR
jgi:hypothetical protein